MGANPSQRMCSVHPFLHSKWSSHSHYCISATMFKPCYTLNKVPWLNSATWTVATSPIFKMEFLSDSRSSYFPKVQQKAPRVCSLQRPSKVSRPTRKVVTPTQLRLRQQQSWFVNILNGKIDNWICYRILISVTTRFIRLTLSKMGWLVIVQQGSLNAHNRGELGKSKERRSEVIITITNIEINTIIVLNLFDKTSI